VPEVDTVARLPDKNHDFGAKNILIEVGILVLDDEDSPKYKECSFANLTVSQQSRCQDEYIDKAISEFFEVHLYLMLDWSSRGRSDIQGHIAILYLHILGCI
jgi:hypothetical protein